MIPYGKHQICQRDVEAVVDVLENQYITQGKMVPAFEQGLANYAGSNYSVAVNSGTSGLHIACLAGGVGPGDRVWTSPISFVASANCALYCGATIDFVDIEPVSRNICIGALADKLELADKEERLPKVLIVVHFSGFSCDMQQIKMLSDKYGFLIIEDAAHALGARYQDQQVGSCQYSDMAVMSFHPVKSITTAEGGAVLTNNTHFATLLREYASHGVTREVDRMDGSSDGDWYYQQVGLGYNYRLSDLHAALGLSQLAKLDGFIGSRRALAKVYQSKLADLSLKLPVASSLESSAWHIYVVELLEYDRKEVFEYLRTKNIGVNVHYIPIHMQPYYRQLGFRKGDFPNAEAYYDKALTLPLFPGMSADEQTKVIDTLKEVVS